MYYNDSDQARVSGLRRAFVESMQELMKWREHAGGGGGRESLLLS